VILSAKSSGEHLKIGVCADRNSVFREEAVEFWHTEHRDLIECNRQGLLPSSEFGDAIGEPTIHQRYGAGKNGGTLTIEDE